MIVLLSTIHVVTCIFLILVVLLQQGKGADLSVFGGGGSQAAFGARGATTLLHKLTVIGFVGFILTTMGIGLLKTRDRNESVITDAPITAPAATEEAAADTAVAIDPALPVAADDGAEMTAADEESEAPVIEEPAAAEDGQ